MNNREREKDVKGKKKGVLEEQTIGYYRRVSEMMKQGFESEEDKALFLNNVFKQLSDEALKVSQNQTVSGIVEELIHSANSEQLVSVMESFSRDWEMACCDRFASHVTQAMLLRSGQLMPEGNPETSDVNTTSTETLVELFDCLYTFLCASIALYMQHIYASHIVRVLLEVLSGQPVSDSIVRSRLSASQQQSKHLSKSIQRLPTPSTSHIGKLKALCRKIVKLQKLEEHVQHSLSNPVLQTVLLSVVSLDSKKSASLLKKFAKNAKLFETVEADDNKQQLPANVVSEIGSHLVEQYLVVISDEQFDRIYQHFMRGKSLDMAQHPIANFVLQKLISQTRTKEQFEEIHDELSGKFEHILALNHMGVLIRLAEGCVKHGAKQKKFVKELQKAFHCYHPADRQKKFISLLASLSTYEVFFKLPDDASSTTDGKEATPTKEAAATEAVVKGFNLHGSLLAQSMLKFGNSHPVVDSLLELSPAELCSVCCDASGCRVIEALVASESVGAAGRERLQNCLTKMFYTLACDKWGSRTFDAVWNAATIEQRKRIAGELSARADALRANRFGSFIHERCALRTFKARPDEWKQIQTGQMKKRKMLQELIGDAVDQTTDCATKKRKTPVERVSAR